MVTYTIRHHGKYSYVYRPLTAAETWRYLGNGYVPPQLERESDWDTHRYLRGYDPPHYLVPAIQYRCHWTVFLNSHGVMKLGLVIRECMSSGLWFAVQFFVKDGPLCK